MAYVILVFHVYGLKLIAMPLFIRDYDGLWSSWSSIPFIPDSQAGGVEGVVGGKSTLQ